MKTTNDIDTTNKQLQFELDELVRQRDALQAQLDFICGARAYKLWQSANAVKRDIINVSFIKRIFPFVLIKKIEDFVLKYKNAREKYELDTYRQYLEKDNSVTSILREEIKSKVSIIVPTKNAGKEFEIVVKKMITQKYIANIELVVVDSGSTDNTIAIAKRFGAKVIQISSNNFSHSKCRNIGARSATGEYFVFTVQDAFFLNEYTLYDSLNFFIKNNISACSARQIPRSDADVFASWQTSTFTNFITPNKTNQIINIKSSDFVNLPSGKKRSLCTIDDVFALYNKKTFNLLGGYNEEIKYGEDLEMGMRMILKGYSLGYLYSNGVVHSHTRDAAYFLKRYFVDTIFLHTIFNEAPQVSYQFGHMKFRTFVKQLYLLGTQLQSDLLDSSFLQSIIGHDKSYSFDNNSNFSSDSLILLKNILLMIKENIQIDELDKAIEKEFYTYLTHTLHQLNTTWSLSASSHKELAVLADKILALYCSSQLATYFLNKNNMTDEMKQTRTYLTQNI